MQSHERTWLRVTRQSEATDSGVFSLSVALKHVTAQNNTQERQHILKKGNDSSSWRKKGSFEDKHDDHAQRNCGAKLQKNVWSLIETQTLEMGAAPVTTNRTRPPSVAWREQWKIEEEDEIEEDFNKPALKK